MSTLKRIALTAAAAVPLVMLPLLFSCSSEQQLSIEGDGSGRGSVRIDLHPMFVQYLKDVSAGFIEGDVQDREFSAFDIARIHQTMDELEGIMFVSGITEGEGGLDLAFVFSDPEAILPPPGDGENGGASSAAAAPGAPLVEFTRDGDLRTLTVRINSGNFSRLLPLVGMKEQETLMTFAPQPDPYTETEYVEMMEYALGDYEDEQTIRRVLRRREATISVEVDGPITASRGFSVSGTTAEATVPFLRAVTLEEPLVYSVTWRPN